MLVQISFEFVGENPNDIMSATVQEKAWCQINNMLKAEPMLIQFTAVYMHHQASEH